MLALFKVKNPEFRVEALKLLNEGVAARQANFVKTKVEERETRQKDEARIKKRVTKLIEDNLYIKINNKIVKPSKKFKGPDGKQITTWDLVKIMTKGDKFLLTLGDPDVDLPACRREIITRLPALQLPPIRLLMNAAEVSKRYDYGRPDEIWESFKIDFEVK